MPWYSRAVSNTKIVGPHIAKFLRWLESIGAFSLRRIHVIGFSLGAEVAGFMGKALTPKRVCIIPFRLLLSIMTIHEYLV